MAQMVKNLPAMQETHVRSLDWEDPLEKGMAIHSNVLAWRIPWTEGPGGLHAVQGVTESDRTERLNACSFISVPGTVLETENIVVNKKSASLHRTYILYEFSI